MTFCEVNFKPEIHSKSLNKTDKCADSQNESAHFGEEAALAAELGNRMVKSLVNEHESLSFRMRLKVSV